MRIEAASLDAVRKALDGVLPGAGWFDDDVHGRDVPAGEWWVVDGAEGGSTTSTGCRSGVSPSCSSRIVCRSWPWCANHLAT
jgi:hypothetical protein